MFVRDTCVDICFRNKEKSTRHLTLASKTCRTFRIHRKITFVLTVTICRLILRILSQKSTRETLFEMSMPRILEEKFPTIAFFSFSRTNKGL